MNPDKRKVLELGVLSALVISCAAFLALQPAPRGIRSLPGWSTGENRIPELIQVKYADTTGQEKIYELEQLKIDGKTEWRILPLNRPADRGQINTLLDEIARIQPVDLIAEGESDKIFGLNEEKRIELALHYSSEKVVFYLGSSTPSGHYYYIRRDNTPSIYTARGALQNKLRQDPSLFRNKQVLDFKAEALDSLIFLKGEEVRTIKRDGNEWRDANGVIPDSGELNSFVKRVAGLKCLDYIMPAGNSTEDPGEGIVSVYMRFRDSEMEQIELTILQENSDSFLVRKTGLTDPFLITRYDGEFFIRLSGF